MRKNNIEQNMRTVQKLKAFKNAYSELLHEWGDLDDIESIKHYPFKSCFAEMEISAHIWVDESIVELEEVNKEGSAC